MKTVLVNLLAVLFVGGGIGLLISPAFAPEIGFYHLFGLVLVVIGGFFVNKMLSNG